MSTRQTPLKPLQHWTVLSLRPRGQHAGLRAAATRQGASVLALSAFAIATIDDGCNRDDLEQALMADIVVWTSPNAVRAAAALRPLKPRRGQAWLCVGSGTRRALLRFGIQAKCPSRMDSEGLLAMPELQGIRGRSIGLVTAPGGRGLLQPTLRKGGAQVLRADVYVRLPLAFTARALAGLDAALAAPERVLLALSSQDAFERLLAQASDTRPALTRIAVVAASDRLANLARNAGFQRIAVAANARPGALLQAATSAFV